MQPFNFNPPEALRPYVATYRIFDIQEGYRETFVAPPFGFSGLIVCLDQDIKSRLNGKSFLKNAFCFFGQTTTPIIGELIGKNRVIISFFQPFGLYQLFGIHMAQLKNCSLPMTEFIESTQIQQLIGTLRQAPNNGQIITLVNNFILSRFPVLEIPSGLNSAVEFVTQNKGHVSVKDMAAKGHLTVRNLERYFLLCLGLNPKEYANVFRFNCLVNFLKQHPSFTWSDLCEQNGYYDQSHILRYYKKYLNTEAHKQVKLDKDFIEYLLRLP